MEGPAALEAEEMSAEWQQSGIQFADGIQPREGGGGGAVLAQLSSQASRTVLRPECGIYPAAALGVLVTNTRPGPAPPTPEPGAAGLPCEHGRDLLSRLRVAAFQTPRNLQTPRWGAERGKQTGAGPATDVGRRGSSSVLGSSRASQPSRAAANIPASQTPGR